MKKFFRMLLLAAVALMPVMGMAQTTLSQKDVELKFEREMRIKQYEDSIERARLTLLYTHQENMVGLKNSHRQAMIRSLWDRDYIVLFIIAGGVITIVVLYLRHSRKKAEDHKELINKLIEKDLLNSSETISKETIEALMNPNPKKSEKDKYIADATLFAIGCGAIGFGEDESIEIFSYLGLILLITAILRLIIRIIGAIIERKNGEKRAVKTTNIDAEIVEEK